MLQGRVFVGHVQGTPAFVSRRPRLLIQRVAVYRKDQSVRAVPSRQFTADISRVLDNVDEFLTKEKTSVRREDRGKDPKSKRDVDDWIEEPRSKREDEWGSDSSHPSPLLEEQQITDQTEGLKSSEGNFQNDGYSYYKASSISVLSEKEKEQILPLIPVGDQASFYSPEEIATRLAWWGSALCGCVLFSSNAWIAGLFLTFPILIPWGLAGLRNWELQSKGTTSVGVWHCQVLNVDILQNNAKKKENSDSFFSLNQKKESKTLLRLLIGDAWKGGTRVEMVVPIPEREEPPTIGELCDLLVLSDRVDFSLFKVVREAFFPRSRLWLAEYPFINREVFYRIVCEIQKQQNEVLMDDDNW